MIIIIRCDASKELGLGHLSRSIAIAEVLINKYNLKVILAMREGASYISTLTNESIAFISNNNISNSIEEEEWLDEIIKEYKSKSIIFDIRTKLRAKYIKRLKKRSFQTILIDDSTDRRLYASFVFYPPVPQNDDLKWLKEKPKIYTGWSSVFIRNQFSKTQSIVYPIPESINKIINPIIMISLGGTINDEFIKSIMKSINSIDIKSRIIITLARKSKIYNYLLEESERSRHVFEIYIRPSNMAVLMSRAHLAIAAFGVTAYEFLAVGTPTILYSMTDDHELSSMELVNSHVSINLGKIQDINPKILSREIKFLLNNPIQLNSMHSPKISSEISNANLKICNLILNK